MKIFHESLSKESLSLLTDPYARFALEYNIKVVLQCFDHQDILQFLWRHPASYVKKPDTLRRRMNEVMLRLGEEKWKNILLDQFLQCPYDSIIGTIGANDECEWECALDRIELFRDGIWV